MTHDDQIDLSILMLMLPGDLSPVKIQDLQMLLSHSYDHLHKRR